MKTLFKGLSTIYGGVISARNYGFDLGILPSYKSSLPVISVGNVTVGGNSKTPLCGYLGRMFIEEGYSPVVLSRGYGGRAGDKPLSVDPTHSYLTVGDEPKLLIEKFRLQVVISANRVKGARFIEEKKLGDIILLDDGLQHRWLKRDIDIVSVNVESREAIEEFIRGDLLPLGRFREDRDKALKRSHVVIFSFRRVADEEELDGGIFDLLPDHIRWFTGSLKPEGIFSFKGEEVESSSAVVSFCGIANPDGFFKTVRKISGGVVAEHPFPDHYKFTVKDIQSLSDRYPECLLVCTEKDAVRLMEIQDKISVFKVGFIKTDLIIRPADEFKACLFSLLTDRNRLL